MGDITSQLAGLTDYEKCIMFAARTAGTTLVVTARRKKIPAPVHRKAVRKLEKLGVFSKSQRISLEDWAAKWVDENHASIPSYIYPHM